MNIPQGKIKMSFATKIGDEVKRLGILLYSNKEDSSKVKVEFDEEMNVSKPGCDNSSEEILTSLSGSVIFTLQSDKNDNVSYTGGKLLNITLQISEDLDLKQSLFSKLVE